MKKILFLNFVCNWCPHYETELELMYSLINEGHDVYSISCSKDFGTYCMVNQAHDKEICHQCCHAYKDGLKLINFPKKNILKLSKIKSPAIFYYKNAKELSKLKTDDINIGFGVYTSFMSITRDYMFDVEKYRKHLDKYLKTAYIVVKNLERILNELKPDEVYLFNGRFMEYWPVIELCKKYGIDYCLHERGATAQKYHVIKNDLFHKVKRVRDEISNYWNNAKEPQRSEIARKWFKDRRNGAEQNWMAFTKEQKRNSLPENFDKSKKNIAIFNSSLDEYFAFDDWQNPIAKNENEIIKAILDHYKNDNFKHFYLRVHPNLKNITTTQMNELKAIADNKYNNLTIIWAEEEIDTYSLLIAADKAVTFSSTVGVETAFWNKPSILAGVSLYSHLDCCYAAQNFDELFKFIDEELTPKNPETTYPFGYWAASYGKEFKYFEPDGLFNGKMLGTNIRKKSFRYKISREIRHPYYKLLKKISNTR